MFTLGELSIQPLLYPLAPGIPTLYAPKQSLMVIGSSTAGHPASHKVRSVNPHDVNHTIDAVNMISLHG
jgi:hypothetical protein